MNFDAGAETPMAGVVTAVGIALTAASLTPLFFDLPTATLAATIIVAVLALVDFGAIQRTFAYSPTPAHVEEQPAHLLQVMHGATGCPVPDQ